MLYRYTSESEEKIVMDTGEVNNISRLEGKFGPATRRTCDRDREKRIVTRELSAQAARSTAPSLVTLGTYFIVHSSSVTRGEARTDEECDESILLPRRIRRETGPTPQRGVPPVT
ncbi:hypothetical protein GWK47_004025 [Chionoecetes opilio]|uniref:Uncharacterized protein n=1 Tax=Chionoecetes opilio TaxID=41210 RepID=A0A8J5D3E6_CHIOP|nr:hypothetical protein GWK47_004025 [Chionoecetes opilio]